MVDTMQASYHHRQVSLPTVLSFIAMTAVFATPLFFAGLHLVLFAVLAPIFALVAVVHWLVYSMTVEVSEHELRWYFGPGFWRKRIVLVRDRPYQTFPTGSLLCIAKPQSQD